MSKAFTYEIKSSSWDSHQTSPGHMLTCLRWSTRDVFNYSGDNIETREPMIIYNDIITCTVSTTKKGLNSQLSVALKAGDINYSTALNPGDIVLVNQVNDEFKIANGENCLVNRAKNLQPINLVDDGFKGLFKVQTCKKQIKVDAKTGKKIVFYVLHAFSHSEFGTVIYYDPVAYGRFQDRYALFLSQFDKFFSNLVSSKEDNNVQELLQVLIRTLIGQGFNDIDLKVQPKPNNHFLIPSMLGPLLGKKNAKYACEIYSYVFGIWQKGTARASNLAQGFNPGITQTSNSFYKTQQSLDGRRIMSSEWWNQVKVWSILNDYLNDTINEMYTTCRVFPDGKVYPCLITRQKPFTSSHFKTTGPVSRFLELPCWKISPDLITDMDIGKDEAARINFVQIYTRSLAVNDANNRAAQVGSGNWQVDIKDVVRSGLKPYLATANFDFPRDGDKRTKGAEWSRLVADWLFGGHLRTGGTITCAGIEEPISVGDNLELDDVVYHIEGVVHSTTINPNGTKSFRTKLTLSFGTDVRSNTSRPVYPDMQFTDYETAALDDFAHERILPGWGEAQDIQGRDNGEETNRTKEKSFTPGNPKRPEFTGQNTGENKNPKKK